MKTVETIIPMTSLKMYHKKARSVGLKINNGVVMVTNVQMKRLEKLKT